MRPGEDDVGPGYRATKRRIRYLRAQLGRHESERPADCPDDLTREDLDAWERQVDEEVR